MSDPPVAGVEEEVRPLAEDPADEPNPPSTREQLWERIRSTSRDEVILREMVRLGFWDAQKGKGKAPAKLIKDIGRLERQVGQMAQEQARLQDRERLLREIRKRRMAEAKQRRQETKERRERERLERAEAWAAKQAKEIVYLGEQVSAGLGEDRRASRLKRLQAHDLPVLSTAADLAEALGVSLAELRFLSFHRKVAETTHYRRFLIAKKTGGQRLISAPMPRLKEAQLWILNKILMRVPVHEAAHGFVQDRNIVTNAQPHTGQDVVVNLDLKNFFPTVTYRRVKGLFHQLGYSEEVSTVLALLATEPDVDEIALDGVTRYVHRGERHLPQGSPASPAITNLICRRLDRRLLGLATSLGFTYTRYADDLTFSAKKDAEREDLSCRVGKVLRAVRGIVEHEDFVVHPQKTRIMRRGARQEVTGLTVNDRVQVPRTARRRLRSMVHQLEKDGPEGKTWPGVPTDASAGKLMQSVLGYAHFVAMVHPEEGRDAARRIRAVIESRGVVLPAAPVYEAKTPSWKQDPTSTDGAETAGDASTGSGSGTKSWWKKLKFW